MSTSPKYQLAIFSGDNVMLPITVDGITLEWTRQGAPGKLTFTVIKDDYLSFPEGAPVRLLVDDKPVFKGYIFEKSRDREQHITCTAYDQLRYFKNKDTFMIEKQKASEFLQFVTKLFFLRAGEIEDTGFIIEKLLCDNKTIFDAVQDTLDHTLVNTGKMFVLFDDAGKICLRDCENMKSDLVIANDTAENFEYTSSIEELINAVKLIKKTTGQKQDAVGDVCLKMDEKSIEQYGLLQHFDNSLGDGANPEMIAKYILELNNRVRRKLSISGAFGDPAIRGGSSVMIDLNLGDQIVKWYAIVDSVTHTFANDHHTMDLSISGKELR